MAIVKQSMSKFDDEGLIDEGKLIKTVMRCNDKLGMPIREIKQKIIPVEEWQADLPLDFEKLYYVCALQCSNTTVISAYKNPFDNSFDRSIIYEAELSRENLGGAPNYNVTIKKLTDLEIKAEYTNWTELALTPTSNPYCHPACPNMTRPGKYQISITDDKINTPFRKGELYVMYLGAMRDEEGNILFPFNPRITPYYEWAVKEQILMDAIFNSEGNYGELLKLAQQEKSYAWLDAFNITTEKGYGEFAEMQKKKEWEYYNKYFKNIK
jgi:hypothetical protein